MRRALKWTGWTLAALICLPLLPVMAVLIGANTSPGRALIERELPGLTGGTVSLVGLSGRFPDALRAGRIEVRDRDGVWLAIDGLVLDWRPLRLLRREASIAQLAAERVALPRLPVGSESTQPASDTSSSTEWPVRIRLDALRVGKLELGAPVAGASADLALEGSADAASLETADVRLAIRRLDSAGVYALNGRIDAASIQARLTGQEPVHGLVSTLAGLPDLGALAIDAALDGPRDAVGTRLAVEAGLLRARADGKLDLTHGAADLTVAASAPAMTPRPDISWQSVALDAHVRGPFATPEVNGTFDLAALHAAGASIERLAAQVQGNAGQATLHAAANGIMLPGPRPDLLAAAPLAVDATAKLDAADRPVTFAIRHPLLGLEGTVQTAGALRANVALTLPDLAPLAAAAGADVRGHTALTLSAAQQNQATDLTVDGTLAIVGGLAPLPGLIGDDGKIGVTAALHGQDATLSRLQLDGKTLTISATGALRNGVLDLDWKTALSDLALLAPTVSGHMSAEGHVAGPQDDLAVTADLTGEAATKGMPTGALTARLEAQHLPGAPVGTLAAQGTLAGAPLDVALGVQQDQAGAIRVDITRADWKSAHADGGLLLPKGATFPAGNLSARMTRLADLQPLIGQAIAGSVKATLATTEQGGRPTARIVVEASDAGVAGTATLARATLNATVANPTDNPMVDAKLGIDGLSAGGMTGDAKLDLAGPQDALAIRLSAGVRELQGAPLTLTGAATLDAIGKQTTVSALQAAWKGETLRLLAPARFAFGSDLAVDRLRLGLRQATLEVAGRASPTLDLTVALRNVTPDLATLVDPNLAADGTLRADAKLSGTTARPNGTIRIDANGLRMRTGPGRTLPAADLTAGAELAGDSARIDTRLTAGRLTTMTVAGRVPIPPSGGSLDLKANGGVDLALLDPILAANGQRVRGNVTLNAGIAGSLAAPRMSGTAQLAGGEVQDIAQGLRLRDVTALVQAEGDTIRIARFNARAGQGTIGLTGTVGALAPGLPIDLRVVADKATPLARDRLQATLGGDLTLRGQAARQLEAGGTVRILRAEVHIPEHMPASVAVLHVRDAGAPPPPPAPTTPGPEIGLNLTLEAPNQIFVRGRGLFAELGGTIHVHGTAAKPVPDGGFQLIRGTFSLAGQSLTFSKGEVGFNSGTLTDPSIDFIATSAGASLTANLEVSGSASNPKIRLFSTPDMPQDEVLAQLIFKQSASKLSPFQLAQIAAALASLSGAAPGGGDPLEGVRKALGLDALSVGGGTGNSGPTVQAGRYVAPGVFVGAKQGTSGTSTQGLVQVDITKGLKLEGTVGTGSNTNEGATPDQSGGSSIGLKYQFEY